MAFEILKPKEREYRNFAESIKELLEKIGKNGGDLKNIGLKALITPPDGFALRIIQEMEDLKRKNRKKGFTRVQLRKIFQEFKNIYEDYKKSKNKKDFELSKLYKLYFIIAYQENRKLIDPDTKYLFWNLLKIIEEKLDQFDIVMEFITALVAYTPKD